MGFESYISESEAAVLAGVGVTTLRRFAEAGYFKIETESDGLKLYARSDLERVFGVKTKPVPAQPIPQFPGPSKAFQAWTPPPQAISPESNGAVEQSLTDTESPESDSQQDSQTQTAMNSQPAPTEAKTVEAVASKAVPEAAAAPVQPAAASLPIQPQQAPLQSSAYEMLDRELHKQRMISEMHERLISIREEEVRGLKDERDWLRARIEKLEEKAARDQVLLLSETQTIKTLIAIQESRRSPVRLALEWLGFVTPPPAEQSAPRSAIDITDKTAQQETKKAA